MTKTQLMIFLIVGAVIILGVLGRALARDPKLRVEDDGRPRIMGGTVESGDWDRFRYPGWMYWVLWWRRRKQGRSGRP